MTGVPDEYALKLAEHLYGVKYARSRTAMSPWRGLAAQQIEFEVDDARRALEAIGLPALLERVEAAEREVTVEDIRRITYNADDIIVLRAKGHLSEQAMDRIQDQIGRQFEGRKVVVLAAGMALDVMAPAESNDTGVTLTPANAARANLAAPSTTPDDGGTP